MKASTLVQANASVVTVVNLAEGDVYKRMEKKYDDSFELKFGIVTGVMANGEHVGITALEFDSSYGSLDVQLKTFGSNTDLTIFHAEPDEVQAHFDRLIEHGDQAVASKKRELSKLENHLVQVHKVKAMGLAGELTTPNHKTLTVGDDDVTESGE